MLYSRDITVVFVRWLSPIVYFNRAFVSLLQNCVAVFFRVVRMRFCSSLTVGPMTNRNISAVPLYFELPVLDL